MLGDTVAMERETPEAVYPIRHQSCHTPYRIPCVSCHIQKSTASISFLAQGYSLTPRFVLRFVPRLVPLFSVCPTPRPNPLSVCFLSWGFVPSLALVFLSDRLKT